MFLPAILAFIVGMIIARPPDASLSPAIESFKHALSFTPMRGKAHKFDCASLENTLHPDFVYVVARDEVGELGLDRASFLVHACARLKHVTRASLYQIADSSQWQQDMGVAVKFAWTRDSHHSHRGHQNFYLSDDQELITRLVDYDDSFDIAENSTSTLHDKARRIVALPSALGKFFEAFSTGGKPDCGALSSLLSDDFVWRGMMEMPTGYLRLNLGKRAFVTILCSGYSLFTNAMKWWPISAQQLPRVEGRKAEASLSGLTGNTDQTAVQWNMTMQSLLPWKSDGGRTHICVGIGFFTTVGNGKLVEGANCFANFTKYKDCNMLGITIVDWAKKLGLGTFVTHPEL